MPCLTAKSGFRQSEDKRNLHLHSDCHIYFTSIVYAFAYGKHIWSTSIFYFYLRLCIIFAWNNLHGIE